ncbi:type I glyceraldehyde-3-phosphate dehydrogenase [Planctellipticum variicoloris]|nr:type I glyceraldehyde-3-phosphate dehydrogenase [Planctomycetaceae bacterium SH412]
MAARPDEFEIVAINDLGKPDSLATLLKYDSVQGRFNGTVSCEGDSIIVNGKKVKVCAEKDPRNLPWKDLGVEIALESTGFFTGRAKDGKPGYDSHIEAGARKVILSAPAKDKPDLTVVMGVNDNQLTAEHKTISNASCTTNCLAPVAMILQEKFGIASGLMTTCHAYTNDQRVSDQLHDNIYRSRAAAINIIPTTTGAAKAVGEVLPALNGKLTGISLRVPVPVGSIVDLVVNLEKDVTEAEINGAIKEAAEGRLKGILEYTEDPIVSSDVIGNPHSSIFHAPWTMVLQKRMVKVLSWYDNEFGYSSRTADLIAKVARL